eukprot:g6573.t1
MDDSFTIVAIGGLKSDHVEFLRKDGGMEDLKIRIANTFHFHMHPSDLNLFMKTDQSHRPGSYLAEKKEDDAVYHISLHKVEYSEPGTTGASSPSGPRVWRQQSSIKAQFSVETDDDICDVVVINLKKEDIRSIDELVQLVYNKMKKDNLLRHPGPPSDFCIVYDSEKHRDISLSTEVDNDFIQTYFFREDVSPRYVFRRNVVSNTLDFTPSTDILASKNAFKGIEDALAELIGNSIQYCFPKIMEGVKPTIGIYFFTPPPSQLGDSFLVVTDNGLGMDREGLVAFGRPAWSKAKRGEHNTSRAHRDPSKFTEVDALGGEACYFADHEIGMYGVGAKKAAFWLGEDLHTAQLMLQYRSFTPSEVGPIIAVDPNPALIPMNFNQGYEGIKTSAGTFEKQFSIVFCNQDLKDAYKRYFDNLDNPDARSRAFEIIEQLRQALNPYTLNTLVTETYSHDPERTYAMEGVHIKETTAIRLGDEFELKYDCVDENMNKVPNASNLDINFVDKTGNFTLEILAKTCVAGSVVAQCKIVPKRRASSSVTIEKLIELFASWKDHKGSVKQTSVTFTVLPGLLDSLEYNGVPVQLNNTTNQTVFEIGMKDKYGNFTNYSPTLWEFEIHGASAQSYKCVLEQGESSVKIKLTLKPLFWRLMACKHKKYDFELHDDKGHTLVVELLVANFLEPAELVFCDKDSGEAIGQGIVDKVLASKADKRDFPFSLKFRKGEKLCSDDDVKHYLSYKRCYYRVHEKAFQEGASDTESDESELDDSSDSSDSDESIDRQTSSHIEFKPFHYKSLPRLCMGSKACPSKICFFEGQTEVEEKDVESAFVVDNLSAQVYDEDGNVLNQASGIELKAKENMKILRSPNASNDKLDITLSGQDTMGKTLVCRAYHASTKRKLLGQFKLALTIPTAKLVSINAFKKKTSFKATDKFPPLEFKLKTEDGSWPKHITRLQCNLKIEYAAGREGEFAVLTKSGLYQSTWFTEANTVQFNHVKPENADDNLFCFKKVGKYRMTLTLPITEDDSTKTLTDNVEMSVSTGKTKYFQFQSETELKPIVQTSNTGASESIFTCNGKAHMYMFDQFNNREKVRRKLYMKAVPCEAPPDQMVAAALCKSNKGVLALTSTAQGYQISDLKLNFFSPSNVSTFHFGEYQISISLTNNANREFINYGPHSGDVVNVVAHATEEMLNLQTRINESEKSRNLLEEEIRDLQDEIKRVEGLNLYNEQKVSAFIESLESTAFNVDDVRYGRLDAIKALVDKSQAKLNEFDSNKMYNILKSDGTEFVPYARMCQNHEILSGIKVWSDVDRVAVSTVLGRNLLADIHRVKKTVPDPSSSVPVIWAYDTSNRNMEQAFRETVPANFVRAFERVKFNRTSEETIKTIMFHLLKDVLITNSLEAGTKYQMAQAKKGKMNEDVLVVEIADRDGDQSININGKRFIATLLTKGGECRRLSPPPFIVRSPAPREVMQSDSADGDEIMKSYRACDNVVQKSREVLEIASARHELPNYDTTNQDRLANLEVDLNDLSERIKAMKEEYKGLKENRKRQRSDGAGAGQEHSVSSTVLPKRKKSKKITI